jgi:hypothetical protein
MAPDESTASSSKLSSFLKKVGEYKEFVALVVFVLGGVFWAFAFFGNKGTVERDSMCDDNQYGFYSR